MNYIKLFENYKTDEEIHELCDIFHIKNYTINEDKSIDVNGSVSFYEKMEEDIPIKFRNVYGYFDMGWNRLKSLKNSPIYVQEDFVCENNLLIDLNYAPKEVGGRVNLWHNNLKTLKGCPEKIGGDLKVNDNTNLYSLEGIGKVNGQIILSGTKFSNIFSLFNNRQDLIQEFVDYSIIRDNETIVLHRFNAFLNDFGFNKVSASDIYGYNII